MSENVKCPVCGMNAQWFGCGSCGDDLGTLVCRKCGATMTAVPLAILEAGLRVEMSEPIRRCQEQG